MKQFGELISKLKSNVIKCFSYKKIEENRGTNNTDNFNKHIESLVPVIINKEDKQTYSAVEDIANALKEKDIKNIALTGSYGSGKSSVLKTLQEDYYKEYTYLNISLATLKDNKENNSEGDNSSTSKVGQGGEYSKRNEDNNSNDNEINRLIEYSILQQIIYKENIDSLPQSRFKRIKNIDSKRSKKYSLLAIGFLLSIIILFEPKFLRITWIYKLLLCNWLNIIFDIISILYMLWILFQVGRKLIVRLCNNKLNKFNIKECAIEINEETSIFNKHLDEILYFFEVTKYNVVIIEDLDRFDTQDIFLKLRELNQIINESKSIKRDIGRVVFIYAVRDDIFKDRNRTKFFDYIVTVISVINSHNSCDILLKEIPKLSERFCNDIGLYIDDMRILINIKNEFNQFKRRLKRNLEDDPKNELKNNLEDEYLFAMIVYKNYFPEDFSKLQNRDGLVYNAIKNKDKNIQEIINEKEKKIKEIKEDIEKLDSYRIKNEKELRSLYIMKYLENIPKIQGFTSKNDSVVYTIKKVIEEEKVFELLINNELNYRYHDSGYNNIRESELNITFKEIESQVDENYDYKTRLNICDHNLVDVYLKEIDEIKKEIIEIKGMALKEMASKYGNIFKETFNGDQELIEFLLTKGYIDENYNNYVSYFYPGRLTYEDNKFIRNIALGKFDTKEQYEYKIDKLEATINAINYIDFKNRRIINHNILEYLANHQTEKKEYVIRFKRIIELIIEEKSFDFIISYFDPNKNQQNIFNELFKRWDNYLKNIINTVNKKEDIDTLLVIYIKYLPTYIDTYRIPTKLLTTKYYLLLKNIDLISLENAKRITEELSIKYEDISIENNNISKEDNKNTFLEYVINNKNYKLNRNNLNAIFNYYNIDKLEFEKATYSNILNLDNQNVIEYIDENIEDCLNELFPESSIEENEDELIKITNWNNESLSEETKGKYLSKQKNKVQNIVNIEKEYWDLAIRINIILSSWLNIYQYFSENENQINDLLVKYIIENEDALIPDNSINEFENEENVSLFDALFNSNILPTDAYEKLISVFDCYFGEDDNLSSLEEDKMKILVENDKLEFSKGIYTLLNDKSDRSLLRLYVINNLSDFISNITEYPIEISDAIYFLTSDKFSKEEKIEIIESFDVDFIENNVQLADIICEFMVNNQYIEIDIDLNLRIIALCSNNTLKLKIVLMFFDRNEYDKDIVTYFLDALGKPYNGITNLGSRPKIPNNELTKKIIKYLDDEEYISSFEIVEDGIRVNTKKSL